jgi:hypothetical protein
MEIMEYKPTLSSVINYTSVNRLEEWKDNKYELNDGNHRLEALKKLGINQYWVIIWGKKNRI